MRPIHEHLLDAVWAERRRLTSRRGVVAGAAGLAFAAPFAARAQESTPGPDETGAGSGAGAEATPDAVGGQAAQTAPDLAVERDFVDDLDVLNYALTLEHLENAFYRDGVGLFALGPDPFGNDLNNYLTLIGQHEAAHVATLTEVITGLGGAPAVEQVYDFADAYASPEAFLATAQALENVGVGAYDGAGAAISDPTLLTAAGTIVAVEALHASYLNVINQQLPAPQPFETPLSRAEVLAAAAPFLGTATGGATDGGTTGDAEGTPSA